MDKVNLPIADVILDSLNDGLYVCDRERRIVYWSKSAERITGWTAEEVVGHRCMDDILCHVDKDGRKLCDKEFCPLHRAMATDKASTCPVIVFGKAKTGERVPMTVSVSPIHDEQGHVVGGVESFHDFSATFTDLERAKQIQMLSLERDLPSDSRVAFSSCYLPHDMVGGDYFAIRRLDADRYGFFLADVMGHGVAAALHTMHLSSLWGRHCQTLAHPAEFACLVNQELCKIVKDESFATAICGVLDAADKRVRFASAGGPPVLVLRPDGQVAQVAAGGVPFGLFADADYDEKEYLCGAGDCLLIFTDGAIEIQNAAGQVLAVEGLVGILNGLGYPQPGVGLDAVQEALLSFSSDICLEDDLSFLEIRFA